MMEVRIPRDLPSHQRRRRDSDRFGFRPVCRGRTARDGCEPVAAWSSGLIGTWDFAGTPDKAEEPPTKGGRLKFITGKH